MFFRTKTEFKVLLIAHIVAGLFPMGLSVYQNILGAAIRSEETTGGLVRYVGFYHDSFTLRLYCFQTLAAVLLYWCYFLPGFRIISRAVLLVLAAIAALSVCKLYSKAGYLIIAEWLTVWHSAKKKFMQLAMVLLFLATASFLMHGEMANTLEMVYSKEAGVLHGRTDTDSMFAGRVGFWRMIVKEYAEKPLALQLVGDGSSHTGAHNDFLRALLGTGIIGLVFYCALMAAIGARTVINCIREQSPLNIVAVMLVGMWFIDAMGLVPGAYPGYQIFVWGFIGLSLRGVEGLFVPGDRVAEVGMDTAVAVTVREGSPY
jgi:O-antigen ligase